MLQSVNIKGKCKEFMGRSYMCMTIFSQYILHKSLKLFQKVRVKHLEYVQDWMQA